MKLLYNPFKKKKKKPSKVWSRILSLGNFTWNNKLAIDKLQYEIKEMQLTIESLTQPKPKRGRPRKNA